MWYNDRTRESCSKGFAYSKFARLSQEPDRVNLKRSLVVFREFAKSLVGVYVCACVPVDEECDFTAVYHLRLKASCF